MLPYAACTVQHEFMMVSPPDLGFACRCYINWMTAFQRLVLIDAM